MTNPRNEKPQQLFPEGGASLPLVRKYVPFKTMRELPEWLCEAQSVDLLEIRVFSFAEICGNGNRRAGVCEVTR